MGGSYSLVPQVLKGLCLLRVRGDRHSAQVASALFGVDRARNGHRESLVVDFGSRWMADEKFGLGRHPRRMSVPRPPHGQPAGQMHLQEPAAFTRVAAEEVRAAGFRLQVNSTVTRSTVALTRPSTSSPPVLSSRISDCAACMVMTSESDGSTAWTRRW